MTNAVLASNGSDSAARKPIPNIADRSIPPFISTLTAILLTAPVAPVFADDAAPWQGRWVSASSENIGSGFANRAFDLSDGNWTLAFTLFADEAQTQPLFRLDIAGHYIVGGPSGTVAEALDAVFMYESRIVTPLSEPAVAMFTGAGCAVILDQPRDATLVGCGFIPSVISSAVEYDLISVNGDEMRLGDRSGDLAKERPAALSAFPLVREN